MEIDLRHDTQFGLTGWLAVINRLPLEEPVHFLFPSECSPALHAFIESLMAGLTAGRTLKLDYDWQPSITDTVVKNLPLGAEICFIQPYPPAIAAAIIHQLKFGRVFALTKASIKATVTMVSALSSGTILSILDDVPDETAIAAMKSLPENCTVSLPTRTTPELGRKLVTAMKPYQVLHIPPAMAFSSILAITPLLPSGCALQLSANTTLQDAASIVSKLSPWCILKFDTRMPRSLTTTMVQHLAPHRVVSLPYYELKNMAHGWTIIEQLQPGHIVRIPPATMENISILLVNKLKPGCILDLSETTPDAIASKIINALPRGCVLKLPKDFPISRAITWVKAIPDKCKLSLSDMDKFTTLVVEASGYPLARHLPRTVKNPEPDVEVSKQLDAKIDLKFYARPRRRTTMIDPPDPGFTSSTTFTSRK